MHEGIVLSHGELGASRLKGQYSRASVVVTNGALVVVVHGIGPFVVDGNKVNVFLVVVTNCALVVVGTLRRVVVVHGIGPFVVVVVVFDFTYVMHPSSSSSILFTNIVYKYLFLQRCVLPDTI
jgi:hypothetical protein